MGSSVSYNSRDILKSPVTSVIFLKPNYIEYSQKLVTLNIGNFDIQHISQTILNNVELTHDVKNKIVYSLTHEDMKDYKLDRMRHIHFIDSNCNCLLKITNDSSDASNISDKLLAINISSSNVSSLKH